MFRQIGQFEIRSEGDVILVRSSPQFNAEAVREYSVAMTELIAHMPARFGVLAQFDEPPIMGPEVEALMRDTARLRAARGMAAVAFVTSGEGRSIASGQWRRLYEPLGVAFALFDAADAAREWLRAQLDGHAGGKA